MLKFCFSHFENGGDDVGPWQQSLKTYKRRSKANFNSQTLILHLWDDANAIWEFE